MVQRTGMQASGKLLLATVVMLAGCQSGQIGFPQLSQTQQLVVFGDLEYDNLYLATPEGVRSLELKGRAHLDPAGRWVIVFTDDLHYWYYGEQAKVTMISTNTLQRYVTRLPFNLQLKIDEIPTPEKIAEMGLTDVFYELPEPIKLHFFDHPELLLGPFDKERVYWHWEQNDEQGRWERWDEANALKRLQEEFTTNIKLTRTQETRRPANIVEMPTDGLTALRTIWVTPDGAQVELLRKNDAPLKFMSALGASLATPAYIVLPGGGYGMLHIRVSWIEAFDGVQVHEGQLAEARRNLQQALDAARANQAEDDGDHPAKK